MSFGTEVPDGATQRHSRIMELLTFINVNNGATLTQIQGHMLATYGLKFRTTSEMLQELGKSGVVKVDGHGYWHLTEKQEQAMRTFLAQDKATHLLDPLFQRVSKVKDNELRDKALKLYERLQRLLQEVDDKEIL
jgi:Mn-dependent DtxR family transcriptional regulator